MHLLEPRAVGARRKTEGSAERSRHVRVAGEAAAGGEAGLDARLEDAFSAIFPAVACGNTERSTRHNAETYVPMVDGCGELLSRGYAGSCPYMMSLHTLIAGLARLSAGSEVRATGANAPHALSRARSCRLTLQTALAL